MSKRSNFRRGYSKREEAWQPPKKKYEPPKPKWSERDKIVGVTVVDAYGTKHVYETVNRTMPTVPQTGESNMAYIERHGTGITITFPARCNSGIVVSI